MTTTYKNLPKNSATISVEPFRVIAFLDAVEAIFTRCQPIFKQ